MYSLRDATAVLAGRAPRVRRGWFVLCSLAIVQLITAVGIPAAEGSPDTGPTVHVTTTVGTVSAPSLTSGSWSETAGQWNIDFKSESLPAGTTRAVMTWTSKWFRDSSRSAGIQKLHPDYAPRVEDGVHV